MIKACVIGWPINHSRSPIIHQYWLKKYGISGSYEKLAVKPDNLTEFLTAISPCGISGCNITLPHKEAAFSIVQVNDEVTRQIGAVNTVYSQNGKVYGLNTDGIGFISNLKLAISDLDFKNVNVVLVGAGGAARAIIAVLLKQGVQRITIANRTLQRAKILAAEFDTKISATSLEDIDAALLRADLLVNTTSLGMAGQPVLKLDLQNLPISAIVTDIVYSPLQTRLLIEAKDRGNLIVEGLGMLLHQAVPGFEKWFGVKPQVTSELYDLVIEDLNRK